MKQELLIFGAGGDLGREALRSFTDKDFSMIYLFDRTPSKINFEASNTRIIQTTDLSAEENVIKAFSGIKPGKDKLFFLFSTIGGFTAGTPIWDTPLSQLEAMLKINLTTSFLIARHFSLLVRDSAGGSICFTSSMTAGHPEKQKISYGISKNALNFLVKTLALEGREIGLSANAVAPSIIDTPENRTWMKDEHKMVKPSEIGDLVYRIFSSFRSVTGNIFELPGNL